MKETVILFGIVALSLLGSLVFSLKNEGNFNWQSRDIRPVDQTAELNHGYSSHLASPQSTEVSPEQLLIADAPPPEDKGTPGSRT